MWKHHNIVGAPDTPGEQLRRLSISSVKGTSGRELVMLQSFSEPGTTFQISEGVHIDLLGGLVSSSPVMPTSASWAHGSFLDIESAEFKS